ncbi:hypothetical protein FHR99_002136 [Litorivivens lipolytica]|uniref:Uncharacterized protein n=1 Tax=Litorivivens lipolytica TaxID=1524264 RepID=A0A7W4Z7B9_9GAMM|nr:hypothetical protein [Litorivivens lipolytica]MBB3047870.1 hypothetical protein [Litorivivens lipolytica]
MKGFVGLLAVSLLTAAMAETKPLESATTGVSLRVPAGFEGDYDADFGGYVLQKGQTRLGIFAYSEGTVQETALAVSTALEQAGIEINYDHEPRYTEKGVFEAYPGRFENQPIALHICAVRGGEGNTFSAVAMAPKGSEASLKSLVESLCRSVQWSMPTGRQWARLFWGRRLTAAGSASNYSQGGAGNYGSYASGTTETYDFCRNGQYAYDYHSESFMSIEGMSASSTNADNHNGQWWLVVDIGGKATMLMDATDGRSFEFHTREQGEGVAMGNTHFTVSQSQRCY